ncbi:MAG: hypothetical protein M3401_04995 [Actinomycetota bacterium]|nr:hypothetical protein [Actinomycetota bacterium]
MAGPLTVAERRRRMAERAGAAAILLAGPLLGLLLFALTGAWPWLVVGVALVPLARLGARRIASERPSAQLRRGVLSPRRRRAAGRTAETTLSMNEQTNDRPSGAKGATRWPSS